LIRFEPCQDWHIKLIEPQDAQVNEKTWAEQIDDDVVANSLSLSCWVDDKCVGAAGIRPIWNGRAFAWSLLGKHAGPAMPAIAKKLRFVLATWPGKRIEMTVREEFVPGCRLALLLGFQREARLLGFYPDGSTALLYARFNQFMGE
jgi:hypothetical protein